MNKDPTNIPIPADKLPINRFSSNALTLFLLLFLASRQAKCAASFNASACESFWL